MKEQLSVQMFTMRDHLGSREEVLSTLEKIKKIGYDGVQMVTPEYFSVDEFKKIVDDLGLIISAAEISYIEAISNPMKRIEEAQKLQCNELYFCDVIWENLRLDEDGFKVFADMLNRTAEIVGRSGMSVHYHFHALEFARFESGKRGIDILIEETIPQVKFMPDTHWLQAGGVEPSEFIKKFNGRMSHVHLKDYGVLSNVTSAEQVNKLFMEVGYGNLDFPAIVESCRSCGVQHYIVEQDICAHDAFESIEMSYKYMKSIGL